MSAKAGKRIRQETCSWKLPLRSDKILHDLARMFNQRIRGWVNYYRIGHSSSAFGEIRHYIVQKAMPNIRRKQLKRGFGWKTWTSEVLYGQYGLF